MGAVVDVAWSAVADSLGPWVSLWATNPLSYVFLAMAILTLTLTRRFTAPTPVWRIPLIDGGAYLLVLLLWGGLAGWRGRSRPSSNAAARRGTPIGAVTR